MRIVATYAYHESSGEWVGVVAESRFFGLFKRLLTVGVMDTEAGIKLWLARVVRTQAWLDASEPADKYG